MKKRGSGILMHITSLPSQYGVGDLGPWAYKFADFLAHTKQTYWQILPLSPTNSAFGNSPYSSTSAFAGNTLLISLDLLVKDGFLSQEDIVQKPSFPSGRCDYAGSIPYKEGLLGHAYEGFKATKKEKNEFTEFCSQHTSWLEDYALFVVLKRRFDDSVWSEWEPRFKNREPKHLQAVKTESRDEVEKEKFLQYLFFKQWHSLKTYCNQSGIQLIGDIPIYVSYDSADVWTNPGVFKLDEEKRPVSVAGVPPDYFSQTGQLWGNPVYRWDILKKTGFAWWIQRMMHNFSLFDIARIDHFRGLVAYWEVPAHEETAVNGTWVNVPSEDFFSTLLKRFVDLPIIAEDLGMTITPDVREVLHRFGLPGMKVLLFAFGENHPMHPYLPHTYEKEFVVYTGTHDNNTVRGWFEREASPEDRARLYRYLGRDMPIEEIPGTIIRLAMMSIADTAIIPMQDVLGLDETARMNVPATVNGNWEWRLLPEQLPPPTAHVLLEMTEIYGRAAS